jgi:N-acetylmuramoyl-L-alanine amidase
MRLVHHIYGSVRGLFSVLSLGVMVACGLSAPVPTQAEEPLMVTDVRIGQHGDMTRFVLDLTDKVEFQVFTLADPNRIVVDLPQFTWNGPTTGGDTKHGLISGYRYGVFQAGQSRLVLDLDHPALVKHAFLIPPRGEFGYRFVLDIQSTDATTFMANLKNSAVTSETKPNFAFPPEEAQSAPPADTRPTIAVDAGHGGVDPGTIGVDGIFEKDVTLAMAKELKRQLEATGRYHVFLTRKSDVSVGLRERVARARAAYADLFISLHADSLKDHSMRGATVYTLRENSSDKEAEALAAKENKADIIIGMDLSDESKDVTNILIDLAQRETMNFSTRFANDLIPQMRGKVPLTSNSHRYAGFVVLKAPDVPSVLIELGYLSNRQDERFISSDKGRQTISAAIARAVDGYFTEQQAMGIATTPTQLSVKD